MTDSSESVPDYLDKNVFPTLLGAMEEMLLEADRRNALQTPKCSFNGLDHLAEILWNRNSRHPSRSYAWRDVFDIPQFKLWLKSHPRPIYPKSWLWTKEEAALRIQRHVRGWLVRKRWDVEEMRQFWKVLVRSRNCNTNNGSRTNCRSFARRKRMFTLLNSSPTARSFESQTVSLARLSLSLSL
ncbi:PREDICTED: IQ domain-containing protein K-like [Vollenhovia emeryi]|uniref:IQ domain-containing protein K-like n=1 Tax=Vollenhovia emeryi TaxID=411798 RepID=UPI0005F4CD9D|nr:PREDICTED: IQ domain-containing protein K-like [Vollenhovia emeryi]